MSKTVDMLAPTHMLLVAAAYIIIAVYYREDASTAQPPGVGRGASPSRLQTTDKRILGTHKPWTLFSIAHDAESLANMVITTRFGSSSNAASQQVRF